MREQLLLESGTRCDGRGDLEVRSVSGEVGVLPVVHGSAHFVRGSTSALAVITLGRRADAQLVHDPLSSGPPTKKHFFAHYAFPMHSKNGRGRGFGANRREVGHSALIEKALRPVIPSHDDFPCVLFCLPFACSSFFVCCLCPHAFGAPISHAALHSTPAPPGTRCASRRR
jgi:polyribonucleotide nucleotidyltransferase